MYWIRTQNNILINPEILVRIDLEPTDIRQPSSSWRITAYYDYPTPNNHFQVLLVHPDMDIASNVFDQFVRWLSQPAPPFQVFDFSRWK